MEDLVRVSKLLSLRGICSRREAEKYIEQKQIQVNGKIISEQGTKVSSNAEIKLMSEALKEQKDKVVIILNKPKGIVSTQPEKNYKAAIELITYENQIDKDIKTFKYSYKKKLAVVGRLDIDSYGLLIFTQDGTLAKKIIGPDANMEKEYIVKIEGNITSEILKKLSYGISLDGKKLKKASVELIHQNTLRIILKEGKKRQIRRMCEFVGLKVIDLKRIRIGNVLLRNLPVGKWRFLRSNENF